MKKSCYGKLPSFLLLMIFSFFVTNVFSQSFYNTTNWRFSNPKQFGFTVNDMDFIDDNKGVAVGTLSGIAYTSDGGATWKYGSFRFPNAAGIETGSSFSDVHFVSSNLVYAVGNNGCMAKSNDAGATWSFVTTPLFAKGRNINTVWFINADKGYIGGQFNTLDSLPKVYFTNNGGATWDSIAAPPVNSKTRVGYPNNPTVGSFLWDVTAKGKEINRIIFVNDNLGYISGTGSVSETITRVASTTNCLPSGTTTTGAHNAGLFWKFTNGTLTDYSISKEKLGYNGIYSAAPNCSTMYATHSMHQGSMRAMHIINDTLVLLISLNNNHVIKVSTGPNSFTPNINAPGVIEAGTYQLLNAPTPPVNNSSAVGSPIPATAVFSFSQPSTIVKAANGKLFVPVNSPVISPANRMMTSIDTGRTWKEENWLPPGRNYSLFGGVAMDLLPSGRFVVAGQEGVVADSIAGSAWSSSYKRETIGSYNKIDFADCNNGMASGGGFIARTADGGNTWNEIIRQDFNNLNIQIRSAVYVPNNPAKAYFATSLGTIYKSDNINAATPTLDPVFALTGHQMYDIATVGNDSVWACGYTTSASATSSPKIFRSFNGGTTWTTVNTFPASTNYQQFRFIEFPSRLIGYVCGNKDTIWKTTDGGVSWNKLPMPTPGVTPMITYTDMFALDENTVFLTGNGFPRKVIFRTTDGGNTWQDITGNAIALIPSGNFNSVVFHDVNNGYVGSAGGFLVTNDGGTTWRLDIPAANTDHTSMSFSPKKVTVPVPFANRKLFTVTPFSNHIMEYGNPANINVNTAETIVNATCSNPSGGSITVNTTGGIAPYTYSIDGTTFQSSNVFTGLTQGTKTITIKDSYCGVLTKTVTVGFTDNLTLSASNDTTVCAGAPVQLQATATAGATFAWTPTAGLSNPNISNPVATISAATTFTVRATLNGCVKTEPVSIATRPNPTVNAGSDKTIVTGDEVQLTGTASNVVSIAWTPSNTLRDPNTLTPVAKPTTTTTYTMTVKNSDNCTSTDDVIVTVLPFCVKVMNAFSPNGDGTNDRWIVTDGSGCTNRIKAAVFNRYGQQVFVNENYQNNWDGTFNGKPLPDGTYYYAISYFFINGRTAIVKGDVTILR